MYVDKGAKALISADWGEGKKWTQVKDKVKEDYRHSAQAAIDALLNAVNKAGYDIVPRKPSKEMLEAGQKQCPSSENVSQLVYRAMLHSAPKFKAQ